MIPSIGAERDKTNQVYEFFPIIHPDKWNIIESTFESFKLRLVPKVSRRLETITTLRSFYFMAAVLIGKSEGKLLKRISAKEFRMKERQKFFCIWWCEDYWAPWERIQFAWVFKISGDTFTWLKGCKNCRLFRFMYPQVGFLRRHPLEWSQKMYNQWRAENEFSLVTYLERCSLILCID